MKALLVPTNMDLVVSSYGGTGTTFFMEFLSGFKTINDAFDGKSLKHAAYPPISAVPAQKFIYLYGNPVHATISLFRRNLHHLQSIKVQKGSNINSPIPEEMTLEEYAADGIDRFGFRDHFYNWYHSRAMNQILFVRYETLFENLPAIFDFAELPSSALKKFPHKRERESLEANISDETLRQLVAMYGDFQNELKNIPDIELRQGKEMHSLSMTFQKSKFYYMYGTYRMKKTIKELYYDSYKN